MNKAQLVEELSARFEGNKKQAQHALESVIDVIQRALVKGEKVGITGFGSFEKIDRAARTARNPATGASVRVKKTSVPKFRPGTELKAIVSGTKKLPKLSATSASRAAGAIGNGRRAGGTAAATTPLSRTARKANSDTAAAPAGRRSTKATADPAAGRARAAATKSTAKRASVSTAEPAARKNAARTDTTSKATARRAVKKS